MHALDAIDSPGCYKPIEPANLERIMLKGLETVVYFVDDVAAAAEWYQNVLDIEPNHVSEHYAGFTVAGHELGLHPMGDQARQRGKGEELAYWSTEKIDDVVAHFVEHGSEPGHPIQDVGGGIKIATVLDPFGNEVGFIENPNSPNR